MIGNKCEDRVVEVLYGSANGWPVFASSRTKNIATVSTGLGSEPVSPASTFAVGVQEHLQDGLILEGGHVAMGSFIDVGILVGNHHIVQGNHGNIRVTPPLVKYCTLRD